MSNIESDTGSDIGLARSPDEPWKDERREEPRIPVQQPARLSLGLDEHASTVRDISGGGALVRTEAPVAIGDTVVLAIEHWGRFRAEVRNISEDGVGLMFLEELAAEG